MCADGERGGCSYGCCGRRSMEGESGEGEQSNDFGFIFRQ